MESVSNQCLGRVVETALRSNKYRAWLKEYPRIAMADRGIEVADDCEIRVLEDDAQTVNLVLDVATQESPSALVAGVKKWCQERVIVINENSSRILHVVIPYIEDEGLAVSNDIRLELGYFGNVQWMGDNPPSPPQTSGCSAACSEGCYTAGHPPTCAGVCNTGRPCTSSVPGGTCF